MEQTKSRNVKVIGAVYLAATLFTVHASATDAPKVTLAEMHAVYKAADLKEKRGKWVNSCGESAPDKAEVVDLDGAGQPGVFLYVSGSCLEWKGSLFTLFAKGKDHRWKDVLPAMSQRYKILPAKHNGYFDIEVLNEGEFARTPGSIYCWNGQRYDAEENKRCGH